MFAMHKGTFRQPIIRLPDKAYVLDVADGVMSEVHFMLLLYGSKEVRQALEESS